LSAVYKFINIIRLTPGVCGATHTKIMQRL